MPDKISLCADDVNRITKELLEKIVGNESYKHSDVGVWNNSIVDGVVHQLVSHDSQFKYIVSCTIVQKNGAGLNTATTCYWDNNRDQCFNVRWENKHLHCIVHIYTLSLTH